MARTAKSSDLWGRAISVAFRRLRTEAGISPKRFEELTGMPQSQLWFLENREVKMQPMTFETLARSLGMTATEFMAHAEKEVATIRKQDPDPILATVIGLSSQQKQQKKKTLRPKAGGSR